VRWLNGESNVSDRECTEIGHVLVKNCISEIYQIHEKDAEFQTEQGRFFLKLFGQFLKGLIENLAENIDTKNLHYVFIVPTNWNDELRKNIRSPIFVETNLISGEDPDCRLLFFSKLESIMQYIQSPRNTGVYGIDEKLKHGNYYLMCDINWISNLQILVNMNAFESVQYIQLLEDRNSNDTAKDEVLSNASSNSGLTPRMLASNSIIIDLTPVRDDLELSLKRRNFNNLDESLLDEMLQELITLYVDRKVLFCLIDDNLILINL
jgi:hypothetical protein